MKNGTYNGFFMIYVNMSQTNVITCYYRILQRTFGARVAVFEEVCLTCWESARLWYLHAGNTSRRLTFTVSTLDLIYQVSEMINWRQKEVKYLIQLIK